MARLPTKKCPRCDEILERIYHRVTVGDKKQYLPLGYICPKCREDMIVLDMGERKQDGYEGIRCPECQGKSLYIVDQKEEQLKCIDCKHVFDLTPLTKTT